MLLAVLLICAVVAQNSSCHLDRTNMLKLGFVIFNFQFAISSQYQRQIVCVCMSACVCPSSHLCNNLNLLTNVIKFASNKYNVSPSVGSRSVTCG